MKSNVWMCVCGAAMIGLAGCMTASRVVYEGEQAEVVAGFSQDDISYAVSKAVQDIDSCSRRYHQGEGRRVINVKPILNDTLSRGNAADVLSESIGMSLKEKLMNHGSFIIYNEHMASIAGQTGALPEFLLEGRLTQRNMRKDNGDVYQEFSLNLTMVCTPYHPNQQLRGLEIWQKRIPLRKEVDRGNAMN